MKIGSLFSGYRGLDAAVEQFFDAETVWWSDIDPGAIKINEHHWPDQPNLGDITQVDWADVEPVDLVTAGWPCQPFSLAGKRKGAADERALWPYVARAVRALRPRYVVLENVAAIATAGELARACADLAALGYVGQWRCLRAADVGAPHGRARIFILATDTRREHGQRRPVEVAGIAGLRRASGESQRSAATPTHTQRSRWDGRAGQLRSGRRAEPEDSGGATPYTNGHSLRQQPVTEPRSSGEAIAGLAGPDPLADPTGDGREQGGSESAGVGWRSHAALSCHAAADSSGERHGRRQDGRVVGRMDREVQGETRQWERPREEPGDRGAAIAWGAYEPAIRRWERVLGRPAPAPTETSEEWMRARARRLAGKDRRPVGMRGSVRRLLTPPQRLSPAFVEWMMGLPAGHVTAVPGLSRNAQLKALGNGVVPQQAYAALGLLFDQLEVAA